MNDNIFENGDTYCVSCGNPMTSEMGSMICPKCQKYLKENIDLPSKNIYHFKKKNISVFKKVSKLIKIYFQKIKKI